AVVTGERHGARTDRGDRGAGRRVEVDAGVDAGPQRARLAEGRGDAVAGDGGAPLLGFQALLTLLAALLLSPLTRLLPCLLTCLAGADPVHGPLSLGLNRLHAISSRQGTGPAAGHG